MHTEDEAKKLWCPMVRPNFTTADDVPSDWNRCCASGCAMWRWAGWMRCHAHGEPFGHIESDPNYCVIAEDAGETAQRVGYCGLAGRPE